MFFNVAALTAGTVQTLGILQYFFLIFGCRFYSYR